jgi:hypothetical protein
MQSVAILQGTYFLITGIWPIVSIDTFQAVTGPKTDLWLVKTVGVVVAIVGIVLAIAGLRDAVTLEIVVLAAGSALGLAIIDIRYSLADAISRIYLLDACVELAIVLLWFQVSLGRD